MGKKEEGAGDGAQNTEERVEDALLKSALGGNVTALLFWLKNKRPDLWRDKPEAAAPGGSVIQELLDCWKKKRARQKRG